MYAASRLAPAGHDLVADRVELAADLSRCPRAVRWAIGLDFLRWIVVMVNLGSSWQRERRSRCGRGRRRPRCRSGRGRCRLGSAMVTCAVAQVADGALAQRQHAAEADAHPAAGRHQHAGGLAGVEQRHPRRRRRPPCRTRSNVTVPPSPVDHARGPEALDVQRLRGAGRRPSARSRSSSISLGPQAQVCRSNRSGTSSASVGRLEPAVGAGVPLDQPDPAVGGQGAQLGAEDDVLAGPARSAPRRRRAARAARCAACPSPG